MVGEPDLALLVLPRQSFQRQIDRQSRRSDHQRGAALGAAEDQELRGPHLEASLFSLTAVIDEGEDRNIFLFENRLQPRQSLWHGVAAGHINDSVSHVVLPVM